MPATRRKMAAGASPFLLDRCGVRTATQQGAHRGGPPGAAREVQRRAAASIASVDPGTIAICAAQRAACRTNERLDVLSTNGVVERWEGQRRLSVELVEGRADMGADVAQSGAGAAAEEQPARDPRGLLARRRVQNVLPVRVALLEALSQPAISVDLL